MPPLIRWEGSYCELISAYGAKGVLRIVKNREKRNGRRESVVEEIVIDRSAIQCIYNALKQFANKERQAVQELPL